MSFLVLSIVWAPVAARRADPSIMIGAEPLVKNMRRNDEVTHILYVCSEIDEDSEITLTRNVAKDAAVLLNHPLPVIVALGLGLNPNASCSFALRCYYVE